MPKIRIHELNGVALLLFTVCVLAGVAITQATKQDAYASAPTSISGSVWPVCPPNPRSPVTPCR
jgi:hypothetical protein